MAKNLGRAGAAGSKPEALTALQSAPEGQPPRFKNPHRITWEKALTDAGYSTDLGNDDTRRMLMDGVVPACCDQGCEVEPDGYCSHRCPSILHALEVI